MASKIVSVRMPSSLLEELKRLAEEHHYLDISEEVRSLLRQKRQEYSSKDSEALLQQLRELIRRSV